MPKIKAIILDRDGTIIEHVPYLANPSGVVLLPGVLEALQIAQSHQAMLFLHTNQSGIGRGFFRLDQVESCNNQLVHLLGLGIRPFERICIAPESPEEPSQYRKPSPEFALEIMRDYGFLRDEICYIGDRGSDLATAAAAGTRGVGVSTGLDDLRAELDALGFGERYPVFDSLLEAIHYLFSAP
jgi:D-glycero-D-manno-heptose 1,7-bisphosphate phosphatase